MFSNPILVADMYIPHIFVPCWLVTKVLYSYHLFPSLPLNNPLETFDSQQTQPPPQQILRKDTSYCQSQPLQVLLMNPFNEAIESTRRPSAIYSPSTLNKLIHDLHSPSGANRALPARSIPETPKADDENEIVSEIEDEVYSLLFRLRQLVGDVDTQPILDQLKVKTEQSKSKTKHRETIEQSKPLAIETEDKPVEKKNTRFALASPLVINQKKDAWVEPPESPVVIDSGSPVDRRGGRPELRSSKSSRYSLGANRFSIRAKELSTDTLNYVNGSKLLRNTTRSSLMTPDPYAFMSPVGGDKAKKHFSFEVSDENTPKTPLSKSSKAFNFAEFCVIGVQNDMLNGLKSLENSSLQPTEVIDLFPSELDRVAIVGNLNEYCFPYGAELKFVTHTELEDLKHISYPSNSARPGTSFHNSSNAYGMQFQIMQFTDVNSVVYYATCVISPEPLEQVSPILQQNMNSLQNLVAASNTIKRYLAYFVHRKKQALNEELNAEWQLNLEKSRDLYHGGSRAGGTKSTVSSVTFTSSNDSKVVKHKSLFKALKKAIGGLRSNKGGGSVNGGNDSGKMSNNQAPNKRDNKRRTNSEDTLSVTTSPQSIAITRKTLPPLGSLVNSPLRSVAGSPLVRQRSMSHDSPVRTSHDSDSDAASHDGAAQVHVDGSIVRTSTFHKRVNRSNRKVALVTQRAYCIISDKPMHALFFQILEAIALKERDRALVRWSCMSNLARDRDQSPGPSSGNSSPVHPSVAAVHSIQSQARGNVRAGLFRENSQATATYSTNSSHVLKRNDFLAYIQSYDFSKVSSAMDMKRAVSVPRSSMKFIDLSGVPGYIKSIKVSYKTLMLKEWTVAILVALVPSELIVKIHSLLLQEQSLLVYGSDAGMVTAIVTAFTLLLQPFGWEGIYVPLLPTAAYEALDAPVPFVIGVVANSRPTATIASTAGVLSLDDFIHFPEQYVHSCFDEATMRHTLASRDERHLRDTRFRRNFIYPEDGGEVDAGLKFFEAPCPDESGQGIAPLLDPMQCSQLKELHQFLAYHAVKIRASLKFAQTPRVGHFNSTSAIKSVMNDLSDEALRSLSHVLNRVLAYNSSICGEVLTQPGGWRQFGVLNSRSNQFEFLPDLFMAPLKAHLRLQESVINTQLFVSFMDAQSEGYFKLQPQRIFISDWVYFRMQRRKRSKRRSARLLAAHTHTHKY